MKMHLITLLVLLFLSCSRNNEHQLTDDAFYFKLSELQHDEMIKKYDQLKKNIVSKKKSFIENSFTQSKKYLLSVLTDSVFHFWYDTGWDFNGITQEPRKGNIACGYFVTTTLLHSGFNIDRVKLAQQPASTIIRSLCDKESIKTFSNGNLKGLKAHLKKSDNGLYIIGLDNHVGFIHKQDTSVVMIHSNYITDNVCRERLDDCKAIIHSKFHMIGNFLDNKDVIARWRRDEKIPMIQ